MVFNEFITDKDKPYAENLNDALCLVDAFDLTVPLNMPAGFSNGEFSSNIGITRKCGVGLVTLMSKDSGVTIGTDSISGSGELVFRIYPNFNSFYKWSKIVLTKTGNVTVGFRRVDGTDISVTVDNDGNISNNTDLRELKEIDLVLTLSSATIGQVLIWFVNDQTVGRVRSSALLEASQLANVNGQVVAGNVEAVNGGTVKSALDNLHSVVTGEIEDLSDSVTSDLNDLHSTISDETDIKLALKEDLSNKVTILDDSDIHYPSSNAVKSVIDTKADSVWKEIINISHGKLYVNESLRLAHFILEESVSSSQTWNRNIPQNYVPRFTSGASLKRLQTSTPRISATLDRSGHILVAFDSTPTSIHLAIDELWRY